MGKSANPPASWWLLTATILGGVVYYHKSGDDAPDSRKDYKAERWEPVAGTNIIDIRQAILKNEPIYLTNANHPIALTWDREWNKDITIDVDKNTWKGVLRYKGEVIVGWDRKNALVFGGDDELLKNKLPLIPLSDAAIDAHPMHKGHIYTSFKDYDWLDAIYPPGSNPEITTLPAKYKSSYYDGNPKSSEHARLRELRNSSYEYRRAAMDHGMRLLRNVLDWEPPNESVLEHYHEDGYKKEYNLFLAQLARVEGSQHKVPAPVIDICNKYGFLGPWQMGYDAICSSPLMGYEKKNGEKTYFWRNYRVGNEVIDSREAFANSLDAQITALHHTFHSKWHTKIFDRKTKEEKDSFYSFAKRSGYPPASNQAASHLVGATGLMKSGFGRRDANKTSAQHYAEIFQHFEIFPYWQVPQSDISKYNELPGFTDGRGLSSNFDKRQNNSTDSGYFAARATSQKKGRNEQNKNTSRNHQNSHHSWVARNHAPNPSSRHRG